MKAMNFYTANGWAGSNYDSKLSTKEIAAKVRSFAKKNFPGFKFSIRTEWSMYADSMYIELKEGTCIPFVEGSRSAERGYMSTMSSVKGWENELTPEIFKVLDAVTAYASSFRYDDSDGMQDYFDTNFYLKIKVSDEYKVIEPNQRKAALSLKNDPVIKFSIICEHELKKGVYMLYCPVVPVAPFFGSERECKKAQAIFEKKLKEEFDKLPDERKKEVLEKLSYYISEGKEGAAKEVEAVTAEGLEIVDYSEKAIAVFGDTKAIKEQLKELGGRFNPSLNYNGEKRAGWIFSKRKADEVRELLVPSAEESKEEEAAGDKGIQVVITEANEAYPLEGITFTETNNLSGVCYFDVEGAGIITSAKVRADIQPGDIFNVYTNEERKYGVTYDGVSLNRSLYNDLPGIIEFNNKIEANTLSKSSFYKPMGENVEFYEKKVTGKRYIVNDNPKCGFYHVSDALDNCPVDFYQTREEAEKQAEMLNGFTDGNGRLRSII